MRPAVDTLADLPTIIGLCAVATLADGTTRSQRFATSHSADINRIFDVTVIGIRRAGEHNDG